MFLSSPVPRRGLEHPAALGGRWPGAFGILQSQANHFEPFLAEATFGENHFEPFRSFRWILTRENLRALQSAGQWGRCEMRNFASYRDESSCNSEVVCTQQGIEVRAGRPGSEPQSAPLKMACIGLIRPTTCASSIEKSVG